MQINNGHAGTSAMNHAGKMVNRASAQTHETVHVPGHSNQYLINLPKDINQNRPKVFTQNKQIDNLSGQVNMVKFGAYSNKLGSNILPRE